MRRRVRRRRKGDADTGRTDSACAISGLVVRQLDDETLVYDLERHEAHCLSGTAALVWRDCDGTRSVAELAARLPDRADPDAAEALVLAALDELERLALIEPGAAGSRGLSRSQLLRRAGAVAAVAAPLVTSLSVPEPAAAASCLTTGSTCTSNAQCCNGTCLGGLVCN